MIWGEVRKTPGARREYNLNGIPHIYPHSLTFSLTLSLTFLRTHTFTLSLTHFFRHSLTHSHNYSIIYCQTIIILNSF